MKEFLKSYGTIIIATVALIQPWLLALWKKYFRQGKIEIYHTGNKRLATLHLALQLASMELSDVLIGTYSFKKSR